MYSDKLVKQSLSDLQFMLDSRGSAQLNGSQLSALRDALGPSPITLIQGPPGTGKVRLRVTGGNCVILGSLPAVLELKLRVRVACLDKNRALSGHCDDASQDAADSLRQRR
jgi:hypothetical protein